MNCNYRNLATVIHVLLNDQRWIREDSSLIGQVRELIEKLVIDRWTGILAIICQPDDKEGRLAVPRQIVRESADGLPDLGAL